MQRQAFDRLVRHIETRYTGREGALRRQTAAWVLLGYAGVLCWVLLLLTAGVVALAAGAVLPFEAGVWLLGLGCLLITYALSQAGVLLLVDIRPPEGRKLALDRLPELTSLLAGLQNDLKCPAFDEVLLTPDFNAGVRELPRLGLFGWSRAYLCLGLPLMFVLSPAELRGVLAHELAHLSARHGKSGNWIYRLHLSWAGVFERLKQPMTSSFDRFSRGATRLFVRWYWPRFHARAMVMSRAHEYHADRVAAQIASGPVLASALWKLECLSPWLSERFWIDMWNRAGQSPEPPEDVYGVLQAQLPAAALCEHAALWVDRGLRRVTDQSDTHPAFLARAQALGQAENDFRPHGFPPPASPSAADHYLGTQRTDLEREIVALWRSDVRAAWRDRHRQTKGAEPSAGGIASVPTSDVLALWIAARDRAKLSGITAAEPLLRDILLREPHHAGASVLLGCHLLNQGDPAGERLLWSVIDRQDEQWMGPAYQALEQHFLGTGQTQSLEDIRARQDQMEAASEAAGRERSLINVRDQLLPHGLAEHELDALRQVLAADADCGGAWLVQKRLQHFPQRRLYILSVRGKRRGWLGRGPNDEQLATHLSRAIVLSGQLLVINRHGHFSKLARKVAAQPDSLVYDAI